MGYAYGQEFLAAYPELVSQLATMWKNNSELTLYFDSPEALHRVRSLVNNLMAAMALEYPQQFGALRPLTRTWVVAPISMNGQWELHVGSNYQRKARGRKPSIGPQVRKALDAAVPDPQNLSPEQQESLNMLDEYMREMAAQSNNSSETNNG